MNKIKVISKSVNNKNLFKEINDIIKEALMLNNLNWSSEDERLLFIDCIEMFLLDLEQDGKIEQSKIVCDRRNNKNFSSKAKSYTVEVSFKQPSCLNTTRIIYHIDNTHESSPG